MLSIFCQRTAFAPFPVDWFHHLIWQHNLSSRSFVLAPVAPCWVLFFTCCNWKWFYLHSSCWYCSVFAPLLCLMHLLLMHHWSFLCLPLGLLLESLLVLTALFVSFEETLFSFAVPLDWFWVVVGDLWHSVVMSVGSWVIFVCFLAILALLFLFLGYCLFLTAFLGWRMLLLMVLLKNLPLLALSWLPLLLQGVKHRVYSFSYSQVMYQFVNRRFLGKWFFQFNICSKCNENEISEDAHTNYCRQLVKYKNFVQKLDQAILAKAYNKSMALRDLSFHLLQGQIWGATILL